MAITPEAGTGVGSGTPRQHLECMAHGKHSGNAITVIMPPSLESLELQKLKDDCLEGRILLCTVLSTRVMVLNLLGGH